MAEEFSTRHRTILIKLLNSAQSKTSASSFISELQRQKEKFPKKGLLLVLQDIAKVDEIANGIVKEMQPDLKSDVPAAECLQRFLTSYEKLKYSRKVSTRQNIETINEDEESSTQQRNARTSRGCVESRASANSSKGNRLISDV